MTTVAPINRAADYLMESRQLLPTTLTSRELRGLSDAVKRQAVFSAQVADIRHLESTRNVLAQILDGELSESEGRRELERLTDESLGTSRVELIVDTVTKLASGYARLVADNDPDVVDAFPAWELYRVGERKQPRDWDERWTTACNAAGDEDALAVYESTGRMIALKDSGVWESLGDSDLFDDALDVNYPPFYFNSGMIGVENIVREECERLGLLDPNDKVGGADIGEFGESAQAEIDFGGDHKFQWSVLDALGAGYQFVKGVLSFA